MGFRLRPRSMTLDDLELLQGQILSEFRAICRLWEATTGKRMKMDIGHGADVMESATEL